MKKSALTSVSLTLAILGCCIHGSGDIEEEDRSIGAFTSIRLSLQGTVYVSNGPTQKLTLQTDENLMEYVRTKVDGHTLVIEPKPRNRCLDPSDLVVHVSTDDLHRLNIQGSGEIVLLDSFETDKIVVGIEGSGKILSNTALIASRVKLDIDGSGEIDFHVDAENVNTSISGFGEIYLAGQATAHDINISGSGEVDAFDLPTTRTNIDINGMGTCYVNAEEQLDVTIQGSGTVHYIGDPQVTQDISGSGKVQQRD